MSSAQSKPNETSAQHKANEPSAQSKPNDMARSKANETESTMETVQNYAAKPVDMVREHPIPATLVMFGVGVGLGMLLASHLCEAMFHQETTSEKLTRQFNDGFSEIKSMLHRGISSMRS